MILLTMLLACGSGSEKTTTATNGEQAPTSATSNTNTAAKTGTTTTQPATNTPATDSNSTTNKVTNTAVNTEEEVSMDDHTNEKTESSN